MKKILSVLGVIVLLGAGCQSGMTAVSGDTMYGVSLSPENFDAEAFERFLGMVPEAGGVLSWAGDGGELALENNAALVVSGISKARKFTPVIIAGANPEQLADAAKREALKKGFVEFAKKEQPPYLGIGNEINFSYKSAKDRDLIVDFFRETSREVKQVSPQTKIFAVFQYEWLIGKQGGLFGKTDGSPAEWDLVERFPDADMIAFTTYPALVFKNPSDVPENYYEEIEKHVTKPVLFTEIGWFRLGPNVDGWDSSEQEQAEFVKRIPSLISDIGPEIIIWPFLFDLKLQPPFEHMGLLEPGKTMSEGWDAWKDVAKP